MARLTRERAPHWVIVTGCDEHYVYIHDPDNCSLRSGDERVNMAILRPDFERMARYGRHGSKAAVVVYPRGHAAALTEFL